MANRADQRKYHYIYKITRTDGSGKYYIGMHSTDDLEDGYFGSGTLLAKSIKKHGKEKHIKEILEFLPSRKALKLREKELVNEELIGDKQCMNLKLGGEGGGGLRNYNHHVAFVEAGPAEHQRLLVEDKEYALRYSLTQSSVMRKRHKDLSATPIRAVYKWEGKKHSAETKAKMSASRQGKQCAEKNSQFGTCWVNKLGKAIKIKKDQLESYLKDGFQVGRKAR